MTPKETLLEAYESGYASGYDLGTEDTTIRLIQEFKEQKMLYADETWPKYEKILLENERIKKENFLLKDALRFYAEPKNWCPKDQMSYPAVGSEVARSVLKSTEVSE